MLKPGDKAPDFKMFNTEKKEVSLSDFKGKTVVLHFFPAAFTGTCTQQLCTLRDDFSFYKNLDAVVLGCSTDTLFTLAKFKESQNLDFDLLSDYSKEVCKAYGAQYDTWIYGITGNAKRSAFIIDGNGIIQYAEVLEKASDLPDFEKMKQVLSQKASN
jgi:peroxiredoxin